MVLGRESLRVGGSGAGTGLRESPARVLGVRNKLSASRQLLSEQDYSRRVALRTDLGSDTQDFRWVP